MGKKAVGEKGRGGQTCVERKMSSWSGKTEDCQRKKKGKEMYVKIHPIILSRVGRQQHPHGENHPTKGQIPKKKSTFKTGPIAWIPQC